MQQHYAQLTGAASSSALSGATWCEYQEAADNRALRWGHRDQQTALQRAVEVESTLTKHS